MTGRIRWGAACAVLMLAVAAAAFLFATIRNDPSIVLVYSRGGADWIRIREAPRLSKRDLGDYQTSFRTRFTLAAVPPVANLEFRAHHDAKVYVNSVRVVNTRRAAHRWKETRIVDLAAHLRPGTNTIRIEVYARNAPRLLWASAPALSLRSNAHWEASNDGQTWTPALPASAAVPSELSTSFPKPSEGFMTILPILGPLFVLVWILHYVPKQRLKQLDFAGAFTASYVRWAILMAWVILAANNILRVPPWVGFDILSHMDYIQYIYRFHRLPLAHEGWQMFQSPLYYVLSVLPYAAFVKIANQDGVIQLLRFLPLLCGIAQVEICYRAGRRVYPDRRDMQIVCTALGGLLPMEPLHLPVHRKRAPHGMP